MTEDERHVVAAAIDSATRSFESAQRALDPERVIAHFAPEFYMYNDGERSGYDAVTTRIRETLGALQHLEPRFTNLEVTVLAPDAGVVSFTFRDSIVDGTGATLLFRGPTTLVWQRRGTDWLMLYADADAYALPVP